MFRRARADEAAARESEKHVVNSNDKIAEDRLNKRLDSEIDQLLNSFGEIVSISRIQNANKSAAAQRTSIYDDDDDDDDDDAPAAQRSTANDAQNKDKYGVAQEAYSAQTRAATMVRSVESLLSMVADIKRARLVNDTTALTEMANTRRDALLQRTKATRREIEELNSVLDAAVRDLEKVYYNSRYVK
ncbi:hypothetical protein GQ54DRAFT_296430 [Martensiomyces pterosporus]|nr:hypothetical protein GQ54DRAFT_296430 [Martensiomyces pterosporus]